MAIKGTVKIELFDAATGAKTDEVISSNMVTNAVRNIVNPDRAIVDGGVTLDGRDDVSHNWVGATSPIGRKLFGGIMLFNKKLTENVDNIIPDQSTREAMIGCAGGGSSLVGNNFRGTYNAAESRELSNGYSHVWDFATNQANGVINAVALTSEWGGEMGWKATGYDMAKSLMPINGNDTWMNSVNPVDVPNDLEQSSRFFVCEYLNSWKAKPSRTGDYSDAVCARFVSNGNIFVVVIRNDRKLMEVYGKNLTSAIGLKETLYTFPVSFDDVTPILREGAKKYEFTSVNGFCAKNSGNIDVCSVRNGIMFVSFRYAEDTLIIDITTLKYENGELNVYSWSITSSLRGKISTDRDIGSTATDGEYLYVWAGGLTDDSSKIYKIRISGNIEESELQVPFSLTGAWSYPRLGVFLDTICVYDNGSPGIIYLLNSSKTEFVNGLSAQLSMQKYGRCFVQLAELTPPWILAAESSQINSDDYIYPMIVSPYLATINNLQTAVTKTASKTMKITYTIQNT